MMFPLLGDVLRDALFRVESARKRRVLATLRLERREFSDVILEPGVGGSFQLFHEVRNRDRRMHGDEQMDVVRRSVDSVKHAVFLAHESPNVSVKFFRMFVFEHVRAVFRANDDVEKQIRIAHSRRFTENRRGRETKEASRVKSASAAGADASGGCAFQARDVRSHPPSARFASRMGLLLFRPSGAVCVREHSRDRAPTVFVGLRSRRSLALR